MSFLAALDATNICSRQSASLGDAAWALTIPEQVRSTRPTAPAFSWRCLARNPQAMALSGMVVTLAAGDAVVRALLAR